MPKEDFFLPSNPYSTVLLHVLRETSIASGNSNRLETASRADFPPESGSRILSYHSCSAAKN